jgi:hypothetical protein
MLTNFREFCEFCPTYHVLTQQKHDEEGQRQAYRHCDISYDSALDEANQWCAWLSNIGNRSGRVAFFRTAVCFLFSLAILCA